MAWIESHDELRQHPKTKRLARLLGVSLPTAAGHLHFLWHWALRYAEDGRLGKYDIEEVAEAAAWDGDPQQFVDAMVDCGIDGSGFLDNTDGLALHDWHDYAGKLIEKRRKDAERKQQVRASDGRPPDVRGTSNGQRPDGAGNRTVPNRTVPKEKTPDGVSSNRRSDTAVREVFAYWQERLGHPHTKLSPDRKRKLAARLNEGESVERLKQAIDGCAASSFHQGENDQGRKYDSVELLFRNAGKVEEFCCLSPNAPPSGGAWTDEERRRMEEACALNADGRWEEAQDLCAGSDGMWMEVVRRGRA